MTKTKPNSAEAEGALLTVQEIAALDRCSKKTVYRAIKLGLLRAIHVGPGDRLLRVTRSDHRAYRMGPRL